jgi:hypothetical protein
MTRLPFVGVVLFGSAEMDWIESGFQLENRDVSFTLEALEPTEGLTAERYACSPARTPRMYAND